MQSGNAWPLSFSPRSCLARSASTRLIFKIDVCDGKIVGVADDVGDAPILVDCPWWREAVLGDEGDCTSTGRRVRPGPPRKRSWKHTCESCEVATATRGSRHQYNCVFQPVRWLRPCHQTPRRVRRNSRCAGAQIRFGA
jgi:hypothetical protein